MNKTRVIDSVLVFIVIFWFFSVLYLGPAFSTSLRGKCKTIEMKFYGKNFFLPNNTKYIPDFGDKCVKIIERYDDHKMSFLAFILHIALFVVTLRLFLLARRNKAGDM